MSDHQCRAESAPDVWGIMDVDPLVGTDCDCCLAPSPPTGKFSKVEVKPQMHIHRGHRGGPVLKSVQCDECGDTEFKLRCRQCGSLFKETRNPKDPYCKICVALNDDWEEVRP